VEKVCPPSTKHGGSPRINCGEDLSAEHQSSPWINRGEPTAAVVRFTSMVHSGAMRASRVAAGWLVAVVVAVDPGGWAPFGPLRSTVAVGGGFAVALVVARTTAHSTAPAPRIGRLALALAGAAASWLAFAAAIGLDRGHALLGTPERHLGLLTIAAFGATWWAGRRLGAGPRNLSGDQTGLHSAPAEAIARGATVAAAIVGAWGTANSAGWLDLGRTATDRVGSSFGSPAFSGAALVALGPLAAAVALDRRERRAWRWFAAAALGLAAITIAGAASRAAMAALATATVVVLVARRVRSLPLLAAATATTVAMGAATAHRWLTGGAGRLAEWRVGWRALLANPLFGTGPEGYRIAFPRAVDASYVAHYGRDVVTDRAHNVVLDTALVGGIPIGLLLVAAITWAVVASWQVARSPLTTASERGAAAAVVGLAIHHQFLFATAEVDVMSLLIVGLVAGTAARLRTNATATASTNDADRTAAPGGPTPRPRAPTHIAHGLTLAALVTLAIGGAEIVADHRLAVALRQADGRRQSERLAAADDAAALTPWSMRARLASATVAAGPGTSPALLAAITRLDAAIALSPDDPLLRLRRAEWTARRAAIGARPADLRRAVEEWRVAVRADPRNPAAYVGLGRALAEDDEADASDAAFRQATLLVPGDTRPVTAWALAQAAAGRLAEARTTALAAVRLGPDDPSTAAALHLVERELLATRRSR